MYPPKGGVCTVGHSFTGFSARSPSLLLTAIFRDHERTDACSKHRSDSLLQPYLDGIVSMQIRNLNSLLESARTAILEKYHPKEEHPIDLKGRPN